jgi:uncharacterized protein (TIGR03435 family)
MLAAALMCMGTVAAQPPKSGRVTFAAADIRAHTEDDRDLLEPERAMTGGLLPDGRLEVRGMTIPQLIHLAYGVPVGLIVNRPDWMDSARFDIDATPEARSNEVDGRAMLKSLLEDRFHLSVHTEERSNPVYALLAGPDPKLRTSTTRQDPECHKSGTGGHLTYTCTNMTMAGLANLLPDVAPAYLPHPLRDLTGLENGYDFSINWSAKTALQSPASGEREGSPLFAAIEKQLGLRIEERSERGTVLVIDDVNRTPAGPPDGSRAVPAAPPEFDVSEIKRSKPGTDEGRDLRNGRFLVYGTDLKDLIMMAYRVDYVDGGPKWLDKDPYDVIARAPRQTPYASLCEMLRALIVREFGLEAHLEQRPRPVYELTVGRIAPRFIEAAKDSSAGCKLSASGGMRELNCRGADMDQFVKRLGEAAPMYFDLPLVNATGLTGNYDFHLRWAPRKLDRSGTSWGSDSDAAGQTVFEAIETQLGLRIRREKRAAPVVVVDRVSRQPGD